MREFNYGRRRMREAVRPVAVAGLVALGLVGLTIEIAGLQSPGGADGKKAGRPAGHAVPARAPDPAPRYQLTHTGTITTTSNYAALGDSFSSGAGAPPYFVDSGDCLRSPNAYPNLIFRYSSNLERYFFACSGAQTVHVIQDPLHGEPPQLSHEEIGDDTALVTLTIGGNDAGFARVLVQCFVRKDCPSTNGYEPGQTFRESIELLITTTVRGNIDATLGAIRAKAAYAGIHLVGYPHIFPASLEEQSCQTLQNLPRSFELTPNEQDFINDMTDLLNDQLSEAALEAGARFVDVTEFFAGHEVCGTGSDWINGPEGHTKEEVFHPNSMGHLYGFTAAIEGSPPISGTASLLDRPRKERVRQLPGGLLNFGKLTVEPGAAPPCEGDMFVPGQELRVSGSGFQVGDMVPITLIDDDSDGQLLGTALADGDGAIDAAVTIPINTSPGPLTVLEARGISESWGVRVLYSVLAIGESFLTDTDGDTVPDSCDVCPNVADPGQGNIDGDFFGDACDVCPNDPENDVDEDGLCAGEDPCSLGCDVFVDGFESGDTRAWS